MGLLRRAPLGREPDDVVVEDARWLDELDPPPPPVSPEEAAARVRDRHVADASARPALEAADDLARLRHQITATLDRELARMEEASMASVDRLERRLRQALDDVALLRRERDRLQHERDEMAARHAEAVRKLEVIHELRAKLDAL